MAWGRHGVCETCWSETVPFHGPLCALCGSALPRQEEASPAIQQAVGSAGSIGATAELAVSPDPVSVGSPLPAANGSPVAYDRKRESSPDPPIARDEPAGVSMPSAPATEHRSPSGGTGGHRGRRCATCATMGGPIEAIAAWGPYDGRIKELIHAMKYAGRYGLSRPLGAMMANALSRSGLVIGGEDPVLVPVPLSRGRLAERGYNQATLLARSMKRSLVRSGAVRTIVIEALVRIRHAPPQAGLKREQRMRNPIGTYAPARGTAVRIAGRRIVLVDDVVTTGATVRECAAVLARAGAGPISIAAVARVPSAANRP